MKKGSLNVPFFQPVINPDGDTPESVLAKVKETGRLPDTDPGVIQALMRQMMESEEMQMVVADAWRTKACARDLDRPHKKRLFDNNKETRVSDNTKSPDS